MKLLLDENIPHDFRHLVTGHEVATVAYLDWKGIRNGELMKRASAAGFDALITCDMGIKHQHPGVLPLAVIALEAPSNRLAALRPLVPALLRSLEALSPRSLVRISAADVD